MGKANSKIEFPSDSATSSSASSPFKSFNREQIQSANDGNILSRDELDDRPTSWFEGRRFVSVKGSGYLLPQDNLEYTRQTEQYYVFKAIMGKVIMAPVEDVLKKGGKVLDIGCSIGTWAIEIAIEYPESKVVGIDMLPVFPKDTKPPNLTFQVANVKDGLPFTDDTFDLVHIRLMISSIRYEEWMPLLVECHRVLRPGAYLDILEPDFQAWKTGPLFSEITNKANRAYIARGFDPFLPRRLKTLMEEANFVDCCHSFESIPCGNWAKSLGKTQQDTIGAFLVATKPLLIAAWGISSEEFDQKIQEALKELDKYQTYHNLHYFYGQKPSPEK